MVRCSRSLPMLLVTSRPPRHHAALCPSLVLGSFYVLRSDNPTEGMPMSDALSEQVGGDHYKSMPIQPVEYIHRNGLTFLEGNVVKYITRHRAKGGAADIRKVIHYCELILALEYGTPS